VQVDVIELRGLAHLLADQLLTGFPSGALAEAIETLRRADALIAVTPVISASYSGLFKTFFDLLEPGLLEPGLLAGKPVLLAATAETARHSLVLEHALRPLFLPSVISHVRTLDRARLGSRCAKCRSGSTLDGQARPPVHRPAEHARGDLLEARAAGPERGRVGEVVVARRQVAAGGADLRVGQPRGAQIREGGCSQRRESHERHRAT